MPAWDGNTAVCSGLTRASPDEKDSSASSGQRYSDLCFAPPENDGGNALSPGQNRRLRMAHQPADLGAGDTHRSFDRIDGGMHGGDVECRVDPAMVVDHQPLGGLAYADAVDVVDRPGEFRRFAGK